MTTSFVELHLLPQLPTNIGQTTSAGSLSVVIASDQTVPVSGSFTATNPSVSTTGSSVPASATLVGANQSGNLVALTLNGSGALKVDGSAVTQPVSGTVAVSNATLAVTQSGTWTVGLSAGSNVVGKVSIDQTTPGTTNAVSVTNATLAVTQSGTWTVGLSAGSNVVGKFGIDQTTPGTTNAVSLTNATLAVTQSGTWNVGLNAGSNLVGKFGIDQTTPGTTNAVSVTNTTLAVTQSGTWNVGTATTTATFQAEGSTAFGSITSTYATVFTPSAAMKLLQFRNNTNAAISVSLDAGTTTHYVLDAGDAVSIDFVTDTLVSATSAIQIKYASSAPTSGTFRVNGCR
jgi:hypothetical protein